MLDADVMSEGFGLEKVEVFAHFPERIMLFFAANNPAL